MDETYTRKDLIDFIDYLANKGLANSNTVQGLRVAVTKILTDLSQDEEHDVRKVNVALAVRRYNNKNPGALSPGSLAVYERRATSAIQEFILYRKDPTAYQGYKGGAKSAGTRPERTVGNPKPQRSKKPETESSDAPERPARPEPPGATSGLVHSFPLRPDFLSQIVLPHDLSQAEAKRLCNFISALAVDFGEG